MAEQSPTAGTLSGQDAAKLLQLESVRRIQQLAADGYIERAENGRYYTVSVVQGYIRFLKESFAAKGTNASENRVRDARARKFEIENARAEHDLIEYTEAEAVVLELAGLLKSEFDGFGARMTRDLPMRRKIEAGIDEIFGRASARIGETLSALSQSGEVVDPDPEAES